MFNSIAFWEKMTYVASFVSIVGPLIILIAGAISAKETFGGGPEKGTERHEQ